MKHQTDWLIKLSASHTQTNKTPTTFCDASGEFAGLALSSGDQLSLGARKNGRQTAVWTTLVKWASHGAPVSVAALMLSLKPACAGVYIIAHNVYYVKLHVALYQPRSLRLRRLLLSSLLFSSLLFSSLLFSSLLFSSLLFSSLVAALCMIPAAANPFRAGTCR
ncbi:hypothetical protein [Gallaecimonas pentaromativorans]|uniref:hypothetical protein n=1 Tax=Gallaecimonas pentaromativorans TaxID=584787 RepID=UPI000F4AE80B|nr:hypothetical protein [Gallaecimonas pentaromativorans]